MKRPLKRRYFLWDSVQPRLVTLSLFYQIIVVAAVAGALFLPLIFQLERLSPASSAALTMVDQFLLLNNWFWPTALLVALFLTAHGVFFTHRIAGPLYRFRHIFREVARGELTVGTSIRKGDYLHREAESLATMVTAIQQKIGCIEQCREDMTLPMERLEMAIERGSISEVAEVAGELRLRVQHLSFAIQSFRAQPATEPCTASAPEPTGASYERIKST